MKSMRPIAFAVLALAVTGYARPVAETLRLKLNEGDNFVLTTTSNSVMELSGMMSQTMNAESKMVQKMTIGAKKDGWNSVTLANQDVTMKMDQEIPGADAESMVAALKDMAWTLEVSERGEVRNYKLSKGDAAAAQMASMMSGTQDLYAQVGLNGLVFPEGPIEVGTKWAKEVDISKVVNEQGQGMMSIKDGKLPLNYEVKAIAEEGGVKVVKIDLVSETTLTLQLQIPGAENDGKMVLKNLGTFTVDMATGMIKKFESNGTSNLDLGMIQVATKMKSAIVVTK